MANWSGESRPPLCCWREVAERLVPGDQAEIARTGSLRMAATWKVGYPFERTGRFHSRQDGDQGT
jgi:hypothetical protein